MSDFPDNIKIAIAWCLAWRSDIDHTTLLDDLRTAVSTNQSPTNEILQNALYGAQSLLGLFEDAFEFPKNLAALEQLANQYSSLWDSKIGLVYGGVTKVKSYVFESADLQEIRGASGLLDRINLIDLPAFFQAEQSTLFPQCQKAENYCKRVVRAEWLHQNFPELENALIPELVVYSTGGNILAFCPSALVDHLANAIERRYTEETLTANSCAVGRQFRLLEARLGLLADPISQTRWLDWYLEHQSHPLIPQILGIATSETLAPETIEEKFKQQKNFNELVKQLALDFEQRRNGNTLKHAAERVARCYPPMFETHPYLRRDEGDHRSAIFRAVSDSNDPSAGLPGDPWFSEASIRKRLMGQITKRELEGALPQWWQEAEAYAQQKGAKLEWPSVVQDNRYEENATESWIERFKAFLQDPQQSKQDYFPTTDKIHEARSLKEIADSRVLNGSPPSGYVAFIYADGNNMGGYIRREIQSPQQYQEFSRNVFAAITEAVYEALYQHLKPRRYKPDSDSSRRNKNEIWLYPFEIVAIGGDDVLLIVPADQALAVAKTLGHEFEQRLQQRYPSSETYDPIAVHRYRSDDLPSGNDQGQLSLSAGVLITAQNTPFYYAEDLTSQLMKSAKQRAKALRKKGYCGGTVDFLVMKSVTMISSNLKQFRKQGLTQSQPGQPTLKQYAAPYTLYELEGLLQTAQALKASKFPRSQLYQIRSLLERGKQTAILNYRYFRLRLANQNAQAELERNFEKGWCQPKDPNNSGNLAPWMTYEDKERTSSGDKRMSYETLWRELVDLYPFVEESAEQSDLSSSVTEQRGRS